MPNWGLDLPSNLGSEKPTDKGAAVLLKGLELTGKTALELFVDMNSGCFSPALSHLFPPKGTGFTKRYQNKTQLCMYPGSVFMVCI